MNKKMANALIGLAPESLAFQIIEIGDLPLYNEDKEEHVPQEWTRFRDELRYFDGLMFVTPEYNRSIPGALKNAIDIGSRPHGKSVWDSKPAAIISVSPGSMGAFGANHHLRQSLVFINVPAMQQPEAYIGHANDFFDENDRLVDTSTVDFLKKFLSAFVEWLDRNVTVK